jgi:hypothetical protein
MPMTLLQADGFYFGFIKYDSQLSMQATAVLKLRSSPNYLQSIANEIYYYKAFMYNKKKMMSKHLQTI